MLRYIILLFAIILLISDKSLSQTQAQIDSITAEFYKMLKNTPPTNDSERAAARRKPGVSDTVHYANVHSYKPLALPTIFETAFFQLSSVMQDTIKFIFCAVDMGELNSETGKLIACDPIVMQDMRPFIQQFPIGRFPVQLSVATFGVHERIAFSRVCFSDHPVVRWEFALDSGQKQLPIFGEDFYTYSVDGGIGIFIDAKANEAFSRLRKSDDYLWERAFDDELDKHDHRSWQYGLYSFQGHNVAAFTTGWGDGQYATYVGYDKDGTICRLLTDFGLIQWWKK